MIRVLTVCMGNICRSPTAEGVLRHRLALEGLERQTLVDSAGTHSFHVGAAPDRRSQAAALRRGIDISALRAREVTPADLDRFEYILAMDRHNLLHLQGIATSSAGSSRIRLLLDFAPESGFSEVPDPYYGGEAGFERVLDLIELASERFVEHLRRTHF